MKYEFKIGWCPYCNQGWAEILFDVSQKHLVVYCEECDTIWNAPVDFHNKTPNPEYKSKGPLEKPSFGEIEKAGWDIYLIDDVR